MSLQEKIKLPKPGKRRKLLMGAGVALLLLAALLLTRGGDQAAPEAAAPAATKALPVLVAEVRPATLHDTLTLPGSTEALRDVTMAAERAGRVEWIGPVEGDKVTEGEVVAKIDMDKAEADLLKARSAYALAKKQAERRKELRGKNLLSQEELDQANTELESATSDLTQAQVNYDQGLIKSPIPGRINDLAVDPGEYVDVGQTVAEIVDVSSIRVNVNVPELDVRYLHVGQTVNVSVDAYPKESWTGQVDFVAYKADEATKTFRTRVVVNNSDGRIRPGMLARVRLERQVVENAVSAPLYAIVDKGGERMLFVEENGVARARNIVFGIIAGDRVQILKGLSLGEKLIVSGQNTVEEGVPVEAHPAEESLAPLPGLDGGQDAQPAPDAAKQVRPDPESRVLSSPGDKPAEGSAQ
ncbi:efflux RND transporter periplasmic adaptor subunit [Paucidesulfovibrio longus]|uniref:efflux RND transporter periplasmic adaptor subunit n=1 Tax=Paucidesulfovibrio longus TaxID=889 RepID=UPI0003B60A2E|nr:efflux RND transporter periplasmic adaptor subunit [Paucidesulfovibrio longus]